MPAGIPVQTITAQTLQGKTFSCLPMSLSLSLPPSPLLLPRPRSPLPWPHHVPGPAEHATLSFSWSGLKPQFSVAV